MPVHLTGGTTDKMVQSNKFWAQMFADMTSTGSQSLYNLVTIRIYGLLTEYKTEMSTPMAILKTMI